MLDELAIEIISNIIIKEFVRIIQVTIGMHILSHVVNVTRARFMTILWRILFSASARSRASCERERSQTQVTHRYENSGLCQEH